MHEFPWPNGGSAAAGEGDGVTLEAEAAGDTSSTMSCRCE
jgi:hypothetical protein